MELTKFVPRSKIHDLHRAYPAARFYDTSHNGSQAFNYDFVRNAAELSSFAVYSGIPVPRQNAVSDTVEGIWQGLKVIKGKIDPRYFHGKGRKRQGKPKGHLFGNKIIGYRDARNKIFIPSYEHMITSCVSQDLMAEIYAFAMEDVTQFFFDVDDNHDVNNTKSPLAHSAVLVDVINRTLANVSQTQRV